jgi:tRNA nucleotidyltransferase/poly(A) polymerase
VKIHDPLTLDFLMCCKSTDHLNLELRMGATTLASPSTPEDALFRVIAPLHENWLSDADQTLGRLMRRNATFWARWAAVSYLREQFPDRLRLEQNFVAGLQALLTAELNERLEVEAERLTQLYAQVQQLSLRRNSQSEMALAVHELLEALRLWYAEVELAAGGIHRKNLGAGSVRLLDLLGRAPAAPAFDST